MRNSYSADFKSWMAFLAINGEEALEIFRGNPKGIVFILLDLVMPKMDGGETFRELKKIDPDVRVIMSSGQSDRDISSRFAGKGLAGFIQKPYSMKELIEKTREVFTGDE